MKVIKKFNCCGKTMVIVIMKEAACCVMSEREFTLLKSIAKNGGRIWEK